MSQPFTSRGLAWFQALAGSLAPRPGDPASLRVADAELDGYPVRFLAVVPDPDNPFPRARQGQVAWRPVLVLALAGLPSNAVGQWLGRFVPEGVLIVAFCLLVLWSAWRMWRGAGMKREASDQARSLPLLGIGLAVGLLSGLMGVGGGFLVVPGLLWFTPLSMMAATATSMAVIALVSGGGFLIYLTGA
ncbi:TPA: TSUP family transporter, partial [Pseudomonas aeruginosa]|nr:TSUP family transporter [Pseudomonas aeruginosa]